MVPGKNSWNPEHPSHRRMMISVLAATAVAAVAAASSALMPVHHHVVVTGETLSGIAASDGGSWQAICSANGIGNCDLIYAGQVLVIPSGSSSAVSPAVRHGSGDSDGDHDGSSGGPSSIAPVHHSAPVSPGGSFGAAPGSFQACVIQRESGGNPHIANQTLGGAVGGGGLYGFLTSTWQQVLGLPGLPQDASVAQQNAAFQRLYAMFGKSPWQPSDHCG